MNRLDEAYQAAKVPPPFKPSAFQQDIFDFIEKPQEGNAIVEAVAGSGKTTTMVEALKLVHGRVLFCAFNKHIADELSRRAPGNAKVSTIHSLGFRSIAKAGGRVTVNANKVRGIIKQLDTEDEFSFSMLRTLEQLVRLVKVNLADPTDEHQIQSIMDHYDLDDEDLDEGEREEIINLLPQVIEEDASQLSTIDFDDMIWLPNQLNLKVPKHDWIFVDEAQDLNAAQRELVLRASAGRMVAVGDSHQAIYGFAGADTGSMGRIRHALGATSLPLSICYRCPTGIVALAKEIVPHIQAAPGAPDGVIHHDVPVDKMLGVLKGGDLVICRINAPLAAIAMKLIREGKKATIRGRDISNGLLALIRKMKAESVEDVLRKLSDYRDRQSAKFLAAGKEEKAVRLADKVETIESLADGTRTLNDLESRIRGIFSDDVAGIVLSSVHRAKGLEADRVFIYGPELLPHPMARGWQLEQEYNLKYVALTRAKRELWFVPRGERM